MSWSTSLHAVGKLTKKVLLATSPTKIRIRRYRAAFRRDGFCSLPRFVSPSLCDQVAQEAEAFYARQGVPAERADRTMNLHQESPTARRILSDRRLLEILDGLLGAPPYFLQSIYFHKGSEQHPHSDYLFMSTVPDFHLCGFWLACEDIAADAGPLVYYPGSHRLPMQNVKDRYLTRIDAIRRQMQKDEAHLVSHYEGRMKQTGESLLTCFFFDLWLNEIHEALAKGNYRPQTLLARKGDVFIWHANLVHGGSPVRRKGLSRKSLVAHYLTQDVQLYLDMNYVDRQSEMRLDMIDQSRPAALQVRP